jgi:diguanylate cyclase (GGDEF)-like protein/PAS domain S-box-containing protein
VRRRAWVLVLLGGFLLTPVYIFALRGWFWPQQSLFLLYGLGSAAGIAFGIRLNRPSRAFPWILFVAGALLFAVGDVLFDLLGHSGQAPPVPSAADWTYLSAYPVLALGLILLVHDRFPGRHVISALDGVMVAMGVGVVAWVFIIAPDFHQKDLSLLHRLVLTAYPAGDLLLLAILARFLLRKADRGPAFVLLAASILVLLVTDLVYDLGVLRGWYRDGDPVDLGYLASCTLWAAAALHPEMGTLTTRAADQHRSSRASILTLTLAALAPPILLVVQDLRHVTADGPLLAVASAVMFILAVLRIASMTRTLNRSGSLLERSLARKLALSRTAVELLASSSATQELFEIATRSAIDLSGAPGAGVFFVVPGEEGLRIAAAAGLTWPAPQDVELDACWRDGLMHTGALAELPRSERTSALHSVGRWHVGEVVVEGDLRGLLLVGGLDEEDGDLLVTLGLLCTEMELAMRIAADSEQRHQAQKERFFESAVKNSSDVVTFLDEKGFVRKQGPSIRQVLGLDPEELLGRKFGNFVHPEDLESARSRFLSVLRGGLGASERLECRVRRADGAWRDVDSVLTNLLDDPDVRAVVLNTRDISDRVALERELQHQALSDALTGLPNRALLLDRAAHALIRGALTGRPLALLYLDLDDFKVVNEGLGHSAGDQLLITVGQRLAANTLPGDTVAHLGGDEFVILLEDGEMPRAAELVAQRILKALSEPIGVGENQVPIRASIGIAFAEPGQHSPDTLLRNADLAMYMAKGNGKGRFEYFQRDMHEQAIKRLHVEAELRHALDAGELEVFFQPIVESATGAMIGAEALVRWRHPERGLVPPFEFIPVAESTGLIVPLDNFVLLEACRQIQTWAEDGLVKDTFYVSVNVSAVQLLDEGIITDVIRALEQSGLNPAQLALEVTETMLVENYETAVSLLGSLKQLGLRLALDDFGTGYSSLSYLTNFPVDIIKIDKSFVDRIAESEQGAQMVRVVIDLADALNLTTVAEGIEQQEQLDVLRELRCYAFQGYLFAKPMPAAEMTAKLVAAHHEALPVGA